MHPQHQAEIAPRNSARSAPASLPVSLLRHHSLRKFARGLAVFSAFLAWSAATHAQDLPGDVEKAVSGLDASAFETRSTSIEKLVGLAQDPESRDLVLSKLEELLVSPETSWEVRVQVQAILERLPRRFRERPGTVSTDEIDRLLANLDADRYATRAGARARFQWLLGSPKLVCPLLLHLKTRLADPKLLAPQRKSIRSIYDLSRAAWLSNDPATWQLPPVSDEQIAQWIGELMKAPPSGETGAPWAPHRTAEAELIDLLARDEYVPRVRQALEARLAGKETSPEARERLEAVLHWTKPAMVAEFWQNGQHRGIQHLLIGVPNQPEGAYNASLFDRIDDRTAHCVSGNTLSPGDYPVGVFFPHPMFADAQFHLVNLPTPRARLAYPYKVRAKETARMAEISERTLSRIVSDKRPITERELPMLMFIDPGAVSRFAGPYLLAVDDRAFAADGRFDQGARPSGHARFCLVIVAEVGTREAIPGLVQAIEAKRLLPPTPDSPYSAGWLAALSIAAHDPWPQVDDWLAGLIERTEPLVVSAPQAALPRPAYPFAALGIGWALYAGQRQPELGATAAAMLLTRHGESPEQFGLVAVEEQQLERLGVPGHYFRSAKSRQAVLKWWADKRRIAVSEGRRDALR